MENHIEHNDGDLKEEKVYETKEHEKAHDASHHEHRKECKECRKLKEELDILKGEMVKLKDANANLDDSYKRKVAEFDNYRKRVLKQMEDSAAESIKKFASDILPIFDNFGRALKNSENNKDFNQLYDGLKITYNGILHFFGHIGVKPMEVIGQEFNPNLHEAVFMEERENLPYETTVVEELEKGYMLGDAVIRHSKVKVAKKKKK